MIINTISKFCIVSVNRNAESDIDIGDNRIDYENYDEQEISNLVTMFGDALACPETPLGTTYS